VVPELAGKLPSYPVPQGALSAVHNLPLIDPTFSKVPRYTFWSELIFCHPCCHEITYVTITNRVAVFTAQIRETSEESLDKLLTKFLEVENIPIKMVKESDSYRESNFRRITAKNAYGKYVVTLPFRDPVLCGSNIGYSRFIALAQFLRNENRLNRDCPLKKQYNVPDFLELGHIIKVPLTQYSLN